LRQRPPGSQKPTQEYFGGSTRGLRLPQFNEVKSMTPQERVALERAQAAARKLYGPLASNERFALVKAEFKTQLRKLQPRVKRGAAVVMEVAR